MCVFFCLFLVRDIGRVVSVEFVIVAFIIVYVSMCYHVYMFAK